MIVFLVAICRSRVTVSVAAFEQRTMRGCSPSQASNMLLSFNVIGDPSFEAREDLLIPSVTARGGQSRGGIKSLSAN